MEKRISFSGVDNGLTNTMNQLRQKSKELAVNMLDDSRGISQETEKQVQYLEEVLRLQERRNKQESEFQRFQASQALQEAERTGNVMDIKRAENQYNRAIDIQDTEDQEEEILIDLIREQIETMKVLSKEEISENKKGVIANVKELNRLEKIGRENELGAEDLFKRRVQREYLQQTEQQQMAGGGASGIFGGMLGAGVFQGLMGQMQGMARAQTGIEAITPMASTIGAGLGFMSGLAYDAAASTEIFGWSLPDVEAKQLLSSIGQAGGTMAGEAQTRHLELQDQVMKTQMQLRALTGRNVAVEDMTQLGLDPIEAANLTEQITREGSLPAWLGSKRAAEFAATGLQYGLSDQDLLTQIRLQRMTGEESMMRTMGRVRAAGAEGAFNVGDRAGMQDMFKNINTMTELLSRNATVNPDSVAAMLTSFSNIGGQFDTRDPRALQNLQTMQGALANPQNEFIKAMQFGVARQTLEQMGETPSLISVMKMMQQGMNSPEYVANLIGKAERMGGDDDRQIMNIASVFGLQGNLEAAEQIFRNREKLTTGRVTVDDILKGGRARTTGRDDYLERGGDFVTTLEGQKTEITNAFLEGGLEGVKKVFSFYDESWMESIDKVSNYFEEEMKKRIKWFGNRGRAEAAAMAYENAIEQGYTPYEATVAARKAAGHPFPDE